jgi:hypothetical protein
VGDAIFLAGVDAPEAEIAGKFSVSLSGCGYDETGPTGTRRAEFGRPAPLTGSRGIYKNRSGVGLGHGATAMLTARVGLRSPPSPICRPAHLRIVEKSESTSNPLGTALFGIPLQQRSQLHRIAVRQWQQRGVNRRYDFPG